MLSRIMIKLIFLQFQPFLFGLFSLAFINVLVTCQSSTYFFFCSLLNASELMIIWEIKSG